MELIKKIKLFFWLAVICFTVNSFNFLFIPVAYEYALRGNRIGFFVLGAIFWLSLIGGSLLLYSANVYRREFAKTRLGGDYRMKSRIGILMFFVNIPGTVSDISFIILFITFIIVTNLSSSINWYFTLFSLLLLSFEMHCIFNGRIYKSTKYKRVKER